MLKEYSAGPVRGPERNAGLDVEVGWGAKRPSPLAVRPLKDDETGKKQACLP